MSPLSVELTVSLVLSLIMVLALLGAVWGFRLWRQTTERDAQRMFEQLDLIRAELMLLSDRMQSMELQTPVTRERPLPVETKAPPVVSSAAPRGYEVAARLARGGATCEELISGCGLSRHEAELLIRLNKAEATRNKPAVSNAAAKSEPPRLDTRLDARLDARLDTSVRKAAEATRARLAAVV